MRNKIFLGTGIGSIVLGILGLLFSDEILGGKHKKAIDTVGIIVSILGLGITAKVLDLELRPDPLEEETPEEA